MFISKTEKQNIETRLMTLEAMVKSLYEKQRLKREKSIEASKKYYAEKKKKSTTGWTPEARLIHGERMKLMWAEMKAKKAQA